MSNMHGPVQRFIILVRRLFAVSWRSFPQQCPSLNWNASLIRKIMVGASLAITVVGVHAASVPTTFWVTSTNVLGPGTVVDALNNANANAQSIILFSNLPPTFYLAAKLPAIANDVEIKGPGRDVLRIVGASFTINTGATALVSRLTLEGGSGLAFSNRGTLTIRDVTIQNFSEGGIASSGPLKVYGSALLGNSGGGIISFGNLLVSRCTIGGSSSGRGIYATGATTRIEYSSILNNVARGTEAQQECMPADNPYGYSCGFSVLATDGIGGGILVASGNASVYGCVISGNCVYGGNALVASYPYPVSPSGSGLGGGVYLRSGDLRMTNCTISGNCAAGGGGARSPRDFFNSPGGYGVGGLYLQTGTVFLVNCTISGNSGVGGPGNGLGGGGACGGLANFRADLQILSSTVTANTAVGGDGSWSHMINPPFYPAGQGVGGITPLNVKSISLKNSLVANNTGSVPDRNNFTLTSMAVANDAVGALLSLGHNLFGTTNPLALPTRTNYLTGFLASDLLNLDPRLSGLQDNGGPVPTQVPLPNSPVIDAGINTSVLFDARERPRTCDGLRIPNTNGSDGTDIGAVEADQSMCYQFIVFTGNTVRVTFTSDLGITYGLQSKTDLTAPSWTDLPGKLTGTGGLATFTDTNGVLFPRRFYRLFEFPP